MNHYEIRKHRGRGKTGTHRDTRPASQRYFIYDVETDRQVIVFAPGQTCHGDFGFYRKSDAEAYLQKLNDSYRNQAQEVQ